MVAEIDIYRSAKILLDRRDQALSVAIAHGEAFALRDDLDGASVWRRIADAIERISAQRTGSA